MFVVAAAIAAAAFVLSLFLEQRPLRDSVAGGSGIGESFAVPKHTDSLAEAARSLTALIGRDERRRLVERLAERAGVDLSAAACWLIVRLREDPNADIPALCAEFDIPAEVGERALGELEERGLIAVTDGAQPGRIVTAAGEDIAQRLIAERRASLARRCEGWSPEQNAELDTLLTELAQELVREPSPEVAVPA